MQIWLLLVMDGHGGGITVDDFQLAAKRAEAAYSPAEWLSLGQRGRSAAIYKELREIDHQAAERLARKIETARRHVREGEVRLARQEAILSKLQTHNYSRATATARDALDAIRNSFHLAKQHLRQVDS